jgi:hypothetical protein
MCHPDNPDWHVNFVKADEKIAGYYPTVPTYKPCAPRAKR